MVFGMPSLHKDFCFCTGPDILAINRRAINQCITPQPSIAIANLDGQIVSAKIALLTGISRLFFSPVGFAGLRTGELFFRIHNDIRNTSTVPNQLEFSRGVEGSVRIQVLLRRRFGIGGHAHRSDRVISILGLIGLQRRNNDFGLASVCPMHCLAIVSESFLSEALRIS